MNRRGASLTGPLGGFGHVGLWGASSLIKSVQRGTITLAINTTSANATVNAVDPANSILVFGGNSSNYSESTTRYHLGRISLASPTTVTLTRTATAAVGDSIAGSFELIEFLPGVIRSVQRGTITNGGVLNQTQAITAVNPEKSFLNSLGWTGDTNSWQGYTQLTYLTLNSATEISSRFQIWNGGGTGIVTGWQVVEFF